MKDKGTNSYSEKLLCGTVRRSDLYYKYNFYSFL